MKIIGLTGGIASGKNFVASIFAKNGAAVFDADKEVHELLASDKSTIEQVRAEFPESFVEQKISRKILGEIVFFDDKKLLVLEKILHPLVRKKYQEFLKKARKEKKKIAVLNIPLLLEKHGYKCDKVIAVVASKTLQKNRFLSRAKKADPKSFAANYKNLEEKFERIFARQLSNFQRKKSADVIIRATLSKAETIRQIEGVIRMLG
jgi:dephospho-CoA kinase